MANIAKKLGNEERLSALLAVLASDTSIPSSEAWPDSVTLGMRAVLLRELRPFIETRRTGGDSLYTISPVWEAVLYRLVECLEEAADLLDEESAMD